MERMTWADAIRVALTELKGKGTTEELLEAMIKGDYRPWSNYIKDAKTPYNSLNSYCNGKLKNEVRRESDTYGSPWILLNYKRIEPSENELRIATDDILSFEEENIELSEGKKIGRYVSYYERRPKLRAAAIKIHGTKCMVPNCGFDYEKVYGIRGKDYIEVHHIIQLSSKTAEEMVNPEKDMVVVCANCHRMIHRKKDNPLSIIQVGHLISLQ